MNDAMIFYKIDLGSGYYKLILREGNEWKITFKIIDELFEWLVVSFRLTNASSTFMRIINDILHNFMRKFLVVYFDDILFYC